MFFFLSFTELNFQVLYSQLVLSVAGGRTERCSIAIVYSENSSTKETRPRASEFSSVAAGAHSLALGTEQWQHFFIINPFSIRQAGGAA